MMIPIRATYRRADKRGGRATRVSEVMADVPMEAIIGTTAQVAADLAIHAGDEDNYVRICRAIDAARADGKIMTIND